MARLALAALGLVLGGCSRIDLNHRATLPAAGLIGAEAAIERGNFSWFGRNEPVIVVDVWSWAAALGAQRSRAREQSNVWGVQVDDGGASFWATSPPRAGVDMSVAGPRQVDLEVLALEGSVWVESVEGSVLATGDQVTAYDVAGPVDLFAWGAIDATVYPAPGDLVMVESARGDVFLGLPRGLDYDLEVDGGDTIEVDDLGFDELLTAPGRVDAVTLPATTTVRVSTRGRVVIYEVGP